jgi:aspartate kinase
MGRVGAPYATDTLKSLVSYHLTKKESDRLISCGEVISSIIMSDFLQQQGIKACAVAPQEVGIKTDQNFSNAMIEKVEITYLLEMLEKYQVIIAPGFLGTTSKGEITTLGRGGSDTSAVALGAALNAVYVDIYSDVEGVMTADPKLVKNARVLEKISYDNLIALAARGAKVIHLKAVELAKKNHVNLRLRSTTANHIGTYVVEEEISSISLAYKTGYTRYELMGVKCLIQCPELIKHGLYWYAMSAHEHIVEQYLDKEKVNYQKEENYVKVTLINQQRSPKEENYFVSVTKLEDTLNFLHCNLT